MSISHNNLTPSSPSGQISTVAFITFSLVIMTQEESREIHTAEFLFAACHIDLLFKGFLRDGGFMI